MVVQLESESEFRVSLSNFDGPFDLLLSLIGKHQLDITQISLAQITDEFVAYVDGLEGLDAMDSASEFVVVASTLLDLKLISLLPTGETGDLEDLELLEARDLLFARLLQYRAFKEVSGWFAARIEAEEIRHARLVALESKYLQQRPELRWDLSAQAFAELAASVFAEQPQGTVSTQHIHWPKFSVRAAAERMLSRLTSAGELSFGQLIAEVTERGERVAHFLAALELYRLGSVDLLPSKQLGDFQVRLNSAAAQPELTSLGSEFD